MNEESRMYRGDATMSLLEEVEKLRDAPLPDVRVSVAQKVSHYLNNSVFDKFENRLACEIIRLLARDVEVRVRKSLSEGLKSNPSIPHDVALTLASDVLEVSIPMLECSTVLNDEDLLEIIKSVEEVVKLEAIARREHVSPVISGALIATKKENVVETLLSNAGASVAEKDMQEIINQFRDKGSIIEKLVFRGDLPISIVMRTMAFVSDQLKEQLKSQYKLSEEVATEITDKSMESATLGVLERSSDNNANNSAGEVTANQRPSLQGVPLLESLVDPVVIKKTKEMVDYLHKNDKLTSSIVLRALCEGNLIFFEVGLSRLAGIPISNAHMLVWASTPSAFHSLYKRANMPMSTFEAVEIVLLFMKQECLAASGVTLEKTRLRQRIVERLVGGGYDDSIPLMPYFITLINSKVTTGDVLH